MLTSDGAQSTAIGVKSERHPTSRSAIPSSTRPDRCQDRAIWEASQCGRSHLSAFRTRRCRPQANRGSPAQALGRVSRAVRRKVRRREGHVRKQHVCLGEMMLAVAPRHLLHYYAAVAALNAAHAVEKENQQTREGNELESSFGKMIVSRCRLVATRADRRRTMAWPNLDSDSLFVFTPTMVLVNESRVTIAMV